MSKKVRIFFNDSIPNDVLNIIKSQLSKLPFFERIDGD